MSAKGNDLIVFFKNGGKILGIPTVVTCKKVAAVSRAVDHRVCTDKNKMVGIFRCDIRKGLIEPSLCFCGIENAAVIVADVFIVDGVDTNEVIVTNHSMCATDGKVAGFFIVCTVSIAEDLIECFHIQIFVCITCMAVYVVITEREDKRDLGNVDDFLIRTLKFLDFLCLCALNKVTCKEYRIQIIACLVCVSYELTKRGLEFAERIHTAVFMLRIGKRRKRKNDLVFVENLCGVNRGCNGLLCGGFRRSGHVRRGFCCGGFCCLVCCGFCGLHAGVLRCCDVGGGFNGFISARRKAYEHCRRKEKSNEFFHALSFPSVFRKQI